jgi:hypothetical protein
VTIQVKQEFPHCERCGLMMHTSRPHIAARKSERAPVVFCSALCRDEYAELFGLAEKGDWVTVSERGGVR